MWKSVNRIKGKVSKTTNTSYLKVGDKIVVVGKEIADIFNSYFCKCWTDIIKRFTREQKKLLRLCKFNNKYVCLLMRFFIMTLLNCFVV